MKLLLPNKEGLLSLLKEPLARFGSHIAGKPFIWKNEVWAADCTT
jgi:hypothetical protein